LISHYTTPGISWPVVRERPVRRTKVIIAGLPMILSKIVLLDGCMIKKI